METGLSAFGTASRLESCEHWKINPSADDQLQGGIHLNASTLNAHARATELARNRRALFLFASGAALAMALTLQQAPVESAEELPLAFPSFVDGNKPKQNIEWGFYFHGQARSTAGPAND